MASRIPGVLASTVVASPVWTPRFRARLLRVLGVRVGDGTRVHPFVRFIGRTDLLSIGRGGFVNAGLVVGSNAPITVGDRVSLGPGVQLLPTSHEIGPSRARAGATVARPIAIGDGAWLGAGVVVLGGSTVGSGCVVAAGAVVTGACEPDGLYAGVPAKRVRSLEP